VEGPSKAAKKRSFRGGPRVKEEGTAQLVGRTTCDRIVVFEGSTDLVGRILPITIEKIDPFTLFGRASV
jgi:tRNA-2-methylthio-N6-dimethylallyladenosine synthase